MVVEVVAAEEVIVGEGEAEGVVADSEEEVVETEEEVAEAEEGVDVVAEGVAGVVARQLLLNLIDTEEYLLQEEKKMPL